MNGWQLTTIIFVIGIHTFWNPLESRAAVGNDVSGKQFLWAYIAERSRSYVFSILVDTPQPINSAF